MHKVRTLVLPVAGMGKRLRPLTLRKPKALVSLHDVPLLEYVLREAEASGIKKVVLIVSPQHETHFKNYVKNARKTFPAMAFYIRVQERPMGDGHAIIHAADILKNEPFAVRFCDDLLFSEPPVLQSLIKYYEAYKAPIALLERVPKNMVSRYGVVKVNRIKRKKNLPAGELYEIKDLVEKPSVKKAPSNLAIVGGYILTPNILRHLVRIATCLPEMGADALRLVVAFQVELIIGRKLYGWEFSGVRLDCGTLEGLDKAHDYLS